jgi:hypothetical protein
LVEQHREDDHGADEDLRIALVDADDDDAAVDHLDHQRAEQRAEGRTPAAVEARAADDRGRDDVELVALAVAARGGTIVAE